MEEREISIKELVNVIWKGKFMILILAAGFLFAGGVTGFIMDKTSSQVATIMSVQWSGVTEGEYPDGTRFDYNTAIEAYVITNALDAEGITNLTTNDIREAVDLVPIVPNDIASVIETALREGEQISYYPTDYAIIMDNGALDISVGEARDLLLQLIEQFRLDFETKYIQQSVILDFTDADYSEYDYIDIHTILETQSELIESAMSKRLETDPGFTSTTLGIGFSDILVRTSLVRKLELEQISSRTATYLLTKDKNYLITNYTYQIDLKQLELDKAVINVADVQALINDPNLSVDMILIPGVDQDIEIDTYYSTLIQDLVMLQQGVSELQNDIAYYELQIDKLDGTIPNSLTPTELTAEIAKVEASIVSADDKLTSITEDANTMLIEYNRYTTSNVIKPLMTPQYQSSVNVLMYAAIGLIVGAGIGAVVVLFKHDWE